MLCDFQVHAWLSLPPVPSLCVCVRPSSYPHRHINVHRHLAAPLLTLALEHQPPYCEAAQTHGKAKILANKPGQAHCQHHQKPPESYANGLRFQHPESKLSYLRLSTSREREEVKPLQSHSAFLTYRTELTVDNNYHIMLLNLRVSHNTAAGHQYRNVCGHWFS